MLDEIPDETRSLLIASIRRFFEEELDQEIGQLKAGLMLDFAWKEIAPAAYNLGVSDAQAWLADRLADLEGNCHADESGYWSGSKR